MVIKSFKTLVLTIVGWTAIIWIMLEMSVRYTGRLMKNAFSWDE